MDDRHALLRAIVANPAENSLRLAYADWLEEHGTSEADAARVEFVRLWFKMKPGLRSTTRAIAAWLNDHWRRLWPSAAGLADHAQTHARAQGRSLTCRLWWEADGVVMTAGCKAYFDRGFAETVQFGVRHGYERFWRAFAADDPIARFEPMTRPSWSGTFPDSTSQVNADLWGLEVFERLEGFDSRPSPDAKVYVSRATVGGYHRAYAEWHGPDRAQKALGDAMTAMAREANGLTPTNPSVPA